MTASGSTGIRISTPSSQPERQDPPEVPFAIDQQVVETLAA
jgi:hypothetical protein